MTRIYLVRHGETDWNLVRRIQGRTDIPLNATGRAQALRTAGLMEGRRWSGVVSSPLARAAETAAIIAEHLGLELAAPMPELIERNYGDAEGFTDAELDLRYPGGSEVPGRESRTDVVERMQRALRALGSAHPDGDIIVVSHGGAIRSLLAHLEPEAGAHHDEPITNGSVHSISADADGLRLLRFDDPLEVSTAGDAADSIESQNALEGRESVDS